MKMKWSRVQASMSSTLLHFGMHTNDRLEMCVQRIIIIKMTLHIPTQANTHTTACLRSSEFSINSLVPTTHTRTANTVNGNHMVVCCCYYFVNVFSVKVLTSVSYTHTRAHQHPFSWPKQTNKNVFLGSEHVCTLRLRQLYSTTEYKRKQAIFWHVAAGRYDMMWYVIVAHTHSVCDRNDNLLISTTWKCFSFSYTLWSKWMIKWTSNQLIATSAWFISFHPELHAPRRHQNFTIFQQSLCLLLCTLKSLNTAEFMWVNDECIQRHMNVARSTVMRR